ncbi:MAG TPA: VWA domain-containing protein [Blastocatellia bacterium]|jgi:VWFA-related protein|nr:VWA domain-containing protein [Blastocatellia bacterium]
MKNKTYAWGLAIALLTAALYAFAPQPRAGAQQDKKQSNGQDQKKNQQQKQEPQQKKDEDLTLKFGSKLVNVLFSVQDKQNRYLNDLKQEDVQILENGQVQDIFTFKLEKDLPLTMAILVDVSGSERYTLPQLKDSGARFVESVVRTGKDTVAVLKFEGEATVMQELTSNPKRVRKALEDIAFVAPPPVTVYGGSTPPINGDSRQGSTAIWDAVVATSADMLAREPGRKVIIVLTDGEDTSSRMKLDESINEALRAEVVVYSIGIGDPGAGVNEGVLKKLSESTGGRAVFPKEARDLDKAFAQLEQDLRQQYLLAYEPKNETTDGGFRKLEIRVVNKNVKDFKIRHRKGYYAPQG